MAADDNMTTEFTNRKSKVLPGYDGKAGFQKPGSSAKYLHEDTGSTVQQDEQADDGMLSEEKKRNLEKESSKESKTLEDTQEQQEQVSAGDEPDEQEEQTQAYREKTARTQQAEMNLEARHAELNAKLDAALAAEDARRKQMYGIENTKKNTMDYANDVYGDEADLEAIEDSADSAQSSLAAKTRGRMRELDEAVSSLEEEESARTAYITESGEERDLDPDVADALDQYSGTSSAANRVLNAENEEYKYESLEFTREEEEKLALLRQKMYENDKAAQEFRDKSPESMTQEEYEAQRQRRFEEYGYPADYEMIADNEKSYEWNGRPLPPAGVDAAGKEREQEDQYTA